MLESRSVTEAVEELERRISQLRTAVREAVLASEGDRAGALRRELRQAEQDWEEALTSAQEASVQAHENDHGQGAAPASRPLLPLREQVHEALSLLTVPAAPRLIATVHEAFFTSSFA